ncbi:hypothetical protein [Siphonobacter sp. SORGH_AS_0500]|uniref:hypothetical protein n=1 Tax=Siphonobacter sp. SORGH_AS_0500 TaxID=1864824 RepID=UPI00285E93B6|nr:hypothetical protein [Siphonobacter sp. SORGH_AS_0500]MDR6195911.1 hypothetical protein [Siphonobacter sp. SORGH_AS_0500]
MVQADGLHREAAFLSNQLHTFRPEDVEGVMPLIQKIIEKRAEWKEVRLKHEHLKKFGEMPPEEAPKPTISQTVETSGSLADLQVSLSRLNVNISKYSKKLEDNPDHKKAAFWTAELDKMNALKRELQQQIVAAKYART